MSDAIYLFYFDYNINFRPIGWIKDWKIPLGFFPWYGALAKGGARIQATYLGSGSRLGGAVFKTEFQLGNRVYTYNQIFSRL